MCLAPVFLCQLPRIMPRGGGFSFLVHLGLAPITARCAAAYDKYVITAACGSHSSQLGFLIRKPS